MLLASIVTGLKPFHCVLFYHFATKLHIDMPFAILEIDLSYSCVVCDVFCCFLRASSSFSFVTLQGLLTASQR